MSDAIGIEIRLEMARQRKSQVKLCQEASISRPTLKKILELESIDQYKDCKIFISSIESVARALNKKLRITIG